VLLQVAECADIVGARVNLAQFVALRFLADDDFMQSSMTGTSATVDTVGAYFYGTALPGAPTGEDVPAGTYPYAYSKAKALKDLFEVYYSLKKLSKLCDKALPTTKNKDTTPAAGADLVRLQLLQMNVEHTTAQWRTVCQRLYDQLLALSN
jgi:hypothetical protein